MTTPGTDPVPVIDGPGPSDAETTRRDRGFFGHPAALANLFGVEMWERFSFYGMQGILLIYMYYTVEQGGLGIDQGVATSIVGAYGGAVYLSTIVGGWVADKVLGSERTLFYSAILIMLGHLALAFIPGIPGLATGLIMVALGSGGLKANATSVVGTLYQPGDPRRDGGFSLFYLGINIGAFFGPILTGLLQSTRGFHWGFGLAAIGMGIGLIQYSFGRKNLPPHAFEVPDPLPREHYRMAIGIAAGAVLLIVLAVALGWINANNLGLLIIITVLVAAVVYFVVILSSHHIDGDERSRVLGFIPLFIASVAFWSLYQQQFTVLTIYADERLDRTLGGWEMPVSWVQAINPVFIIILSGVFAAVWTRLGDRQPSTPIKFAVGNVLMGLAFLLFLPFAGGPPNSTPLIALIGIIFVFTIAELFLSPVAMSVSTKLAPVAFLTQMVALYYLSVSLGTTIAGELGKLYTPENEAPYFGVLGTIAIAIGVLLALASRWVLKLMRGVK